MNSLAQVLQRAPDVSVQGVSEADASAFARLAADLASAPLPGMPEMEQARDYVRSCAAVTLGQDVIELVGYHAAWATRESRTFRLTLSPGTASVSCHDQARSDRALERLRVDPVADHLSLYVGDAGLFELGEKQVTRAVTEWSAKSRARMFRTVPTLDMSEWDDQDGNLAMLTATLPGLWAHLTPTGRDFKKMMERLRRRWLHAGMIWRGLWKLEFQGRGAPHLHALMKIPATVDVAGEKEVFSVWFARTWAEVVGSDDDWCWKCLPEMRGPLTWASIKAACSCEVPDTERRRHGVAGTGIDFSGTKFSDPRRITTYFLGHSSKHTDGKEYQHIVPEAWSAPGAGPGRFWGYWGMKKGTVHVDLDQAEWYQVRRMLRKIAKARAWKQTQDAAKYGKTIQRRPLRSLGHRGGNQGGTVVVNDGLALAYDIGRALSVWAYQDRLDAQPDSPREVRFRELIARQGMSWYDDITFPEVD